MIVVSLLLLFHRKVCPSEIPSNLYSSCIKNQHSLKLGRRKPRESFFDDELRRIRLSKAQGASQTKTYSDLFSSSYFHQTTTQVPEHFLQRSDVYDKIVKAQHPTFVTQVWFLFSLSGLYTWFPAFLFLPLEREKRA